MVFLHLIFFYIIIQKQNYIIKKGQDINQDSGYDNKRRDTKH